MFAFAQKLVALGMFVFAVNVGAQNVHGVLRVVKGDVQIKVAKTGEKIKARIGGKVFPKDVILTGKDARAKIVMIDKNEINVSPQSQIEIQNYEFNPEPGGKKEVLLNVIYGKVRSKVEQKYDGKTSKFLIKTPSAVAGVRGTDFLMSFNQSNRQSQVVTFEGRVEFGVPGPGGAIANPVMVEPGKAASVNAGSSAPTPPREMPKEELNRMEQDTKSEARRPTENGDTAKNEGKRDSDGGDKPKADNNRSENEGDKGKADSRPSEGDGGDKPKSENARGNNVNGTSDGDKPKSEASGENNNARPNGANTNANNNGSKPPEDARSSQPAESSSTPGSTGARPGTTSNNGETSNAGSSASSSPRPPASQASTNSNSIVRQPAATTAPATTNPPPVNAPNGPSLGSSSGPPMPPVATQPAAAINTPAISPAGGGSMFRPEDFASTPLPSLPTVEIVVPNLVPVVPINPLPVCDEFCRGIFTDGPTKLKINITY